MRKIGDKGISKIGEMELGWRYLRGPVGAVTGTNGKTTVLALSEAILKGKGGVACGNVGNPVSNFAGREGIFLLEASSFQLYSTEHFRPDIAVILNISEDHIDWHEDLESYRAAKARIFANQGQDDALVLNSDDPATRSLETESPSQCFFFSLEKKVNGAFLRDEVLVLEAGEDSFELVRAKELLIPGVHNIANALAASLFTRLLGADRDDIRAALRSFAGLPHRLEYVRDVNGARVLNDSKSTNPHSVLWALRSMETPVVLIMGGLDKDLDFGGLKEPIERKARALVLLGQAAPKLEEGFRDLVPVVRAHDLEDAVRKSLDLAKEGDAVLFSPGCASFDMFKDYKDRGNQFKALVRGLDDEP
jgi:UDP-N-acetylmuramoylalanine--D-glutamate ligase